MTFRFVRGTISVAALVLILAATSWAQGRAISGVVRNVDTATRTVHFVDGRALLVASDAVLTIDGQRTDLESVRPGRSLVVQQRDVPAVAVAQAAPATVVTQPAPAQVAVLPQHPPIDAQGTVARVDEQAGLVIFEDGRAVKLTDRSTLWQPVSRQSLKPGTQLYVHNAQPATFQAAQSWNGPMMMGTVSRVDSGRTLLVLEDGTMLRLVPDAKLHFKGQPATIAQLQPGDQLVIRVVPAASSTGESPSALPRDAMTPMTYEAQEVYIIRVQ